jgi:hypothetical protein
MIMKKVFILVILSIIATSVVMSQTGPKRPALPNNLAKYVDEYPVELMKVTSVKRRLRTLLGKRYSDFEHAISVQSPIKRQGDILFASGCLAHACTINEAAFVIDLKNKRIHAVIYEKDSPAQFFNEDKAPTPQILLDWIKEFESDAGMP